MGQFSSSIFEQCRKAGSEVDLKQCKIAFSPLGELSSTTAHISGVERFGLTEPNGFSSDADIAGIGVSWN